MKMKKKKGGVVATLINVEYFNLEDSHEKAKKPQYKGHNIKDMPKEDWNF